MKHLPHRAAQDKGAGDGEDLLRRPVEGGHDLFPVEGEDSRSDVLQNLFHVLPAMGELEVGLLEGLGGKSQVGGHLVEGFHKDPELLLSGEGNPDREVPPGHLLGGLFKGQKGTGDPAGEVEAKPDGAKDDHDGDHEENQEVGLPDGISKLPQLPVVGVGPGKRGQRPGKALRHQVVDDENRRQGRSSLRYGDGNESPDKDAHPAL